MCIVGQFGRFTPNCVAYAAFRFRLPGPADFELRGNRHQAMRVRDGRSVLQGDPEPVRPSNLPPAASPMGDEAASDLGRTKRVSAWPLGCQMLLVPHRIIAVLKCPESSSTRRHFRFESVVGRSPTTQLRVHASDHPAQASPSVTNRSPLVGQFWPGRSAPPRPFSRRCVSSFLGTRKASHFSPSFSTAPRIWAGPVRIQPTSGSFHLPSPILVAATGRMNSRSFTTTILTSLLLRCTHDLSAGAQVDISDQVEGMVLGVAASGHKSISIAVDLNPCNRINHQHHPARVRERPPAPMLLEAERWRF